MNDATHRIGWRRVVGGAVLAACALGLVACAGGGGRAAAGRSVDAGPLKDYVRDGTYDRFAESEGFMLVTFGGRLTAVSAVCTADGATLVKSKYDDGFVCPRDHSHFSREGHAREGRAQQALVHYPMSLDSRGHVFVETGRPLEQSAWGRPDAYLVPR